MSDIEVKPRLEKLGSFGPSTCYLVLVGDEEIGRVIGKTQNTKVLWWSALGYKHPTTGKGFYKDGFLNQRKEAVAALMAWWQS
jgi:hypothetical protein